MLLNSSDERWVELPAPDEPKDSEPGFSLASAMSSRTLFAGSSGGTTSTLVIEATKITGSKSFAASYVMFGYSALLIDITPVGAISSVYPSGAARATTSA